MMKCSDEFFGIIESLYEKSCDYYFLTSMNYLTENKVEAASDYFLNEIQWISEKFKIDEKASLLLSAFFIQYYAKDQLLLNFITSEDLMRSIGLAKEEFDRFEMEIKGLLSTNVIFQSTIKNNQLENFSRIDEKMDVYFVDADIKNNTFTFSLTDGFVNQLIF